MKRKVVYIPLISIILCITGAWYYLFIYSKYYHRNINNATPIIVLADTIASNYLTNEPQANLIYLDKVVQVTGLVIEVGINQQNNTTISLQTINPMTTIFCTLTTNVPNIKIQSLINIKGICIGFTSDVKIKDAIIVNN